MAKKIYTEKEFKERLEKEIHAYWERQEERERQNRLYRRIEELEERLYRLEHKGESEQRVGECVCCESTRPIR